jgi:U3 small nucleolar RNA-associated protein 14
MRDEDLPVTEALKMNHLSVEEVAARRAELRKMRELMFRAELKAKRAAKIKSKTYRRIRKKQREKLDTVAVGEDEVEMGEDERYKAEVERARERATLRHKNTGKWVQAMKAKGELDIDQRREILEMLERGEELRRRIQGKTGDNEEDEDSDSDAEPGEEDIETYAFNQLAKLQSEDDNDTHIATKGKGVFQMKFMKDAMAREQHKTRGMVDDFIQAIHNLHEHNSESGGSAFDADGTETTVAIERSGGRMSFRPAPVVITHGLSGMMHSH